MGCQLFLYHTIFQSTLPQGERPWGRCLCDCENIYFNPRSRKGSDPFQSPDFTFQRDFNPRSRKGSDLALMSTTGFRHKFQSTLPQGERPSNGDICFIISAFQSTLPQGERLQRGGSSSDNIIFQSTLPQGERPGGDVSVLFVMNFNPRSRKGSDFSDRL